MDSVTVYTLGFTQKNAQEFFGLLERAGVQRVLDIRLNNRSQLAGFTKQPDLAFFLKRILGVDCQHMPELAPTPEILDAYKARRMDWATYEKRFRSLLVERRIESLITRSMAQNVCLLCSEPTAERCHRRLVAEYLQGLWPDVRVVHL